MQPPPGYNYGPPAPRGGPHGQQPSQGPGSTGAASGAYTGYPTPQSPQQQQQQQPYQQQQQPYQQQQQQYAGYGQPQQPLGQPYGQPGYGSASAGGFSAGGYPGPTPSASQQFIPGAPQQQQYSQYGPASGHAQFQMPFPSGPSSQGAPGGGAVDPAGFMSGLSPLGLMAAGGLLSGPQQYMQQRMGWLKTNMTGGTMSALFNVTPSYVGSKLLMLLAPFLGKFTYTRTLEQIAGGQKYKPPAADANAPDLFIPLMAAWTYALVNCCLMAAKGEFRPEAMNNMVYGTCVAWGVHWVVAWLVLRAMSVPGVPWSELLAYVGYAFVPVCLAAVAQQLGGRAAYYAVWAYGSVCMGVFMVRTMKRVMFQEARQYAQDVKLTNYLLLALAAFQFPWSWWLGFAPKGLR